MARLHPVLTPKQQKKADRAAAQDKDCARWMPRSAPRAPVGPRLHRLALVARLLVLPVMLLVADGDQHLLPPQCAGHTMATAATMFLFALFVLSIWLAWRGYQREARVRGPSRSSEG